MSESTLTQVLALWGALLSSVLLGWTIYRDLRDSGRLRVSCSFMVAVGPGEALEYDVLTYIITNTGRRPVRVASAGGMFKGNETGFLLTDHELPKMLAPGEYLHSHCREFTPELLDGVTLLCAHDSLGRRFQARRKQVKAVNEHLAVLKAKGQTKSRFERLGE